jgi:hypothetical protein
MCRKPVITTQTLLRKQLVIMTVLLQNTARSLSTSKELGALHNKTSDEVALILDCKACDLKKKLDRLRHESGKV